MALASNAIIMFIVFANADTGGFDLGSIHMKYYRLLLVGRCKIDAFIFIRNKLWVLQN